MFLAELKVLHLRAAISTPRINAFGVQRWREAVLVRLSDNTGHYGWGEVFSNWPPGGARYRTELLRSVFAPLVQGREVCRPEQLARGLEEQARLLALQCGDRGAFAQCLAGIDVAAWDLWCKQRELSLASALGSVTPVESVAVYASGIGPNWLERGSRVARELSIGAVKVKVGFGIERDLETLREVRRLIGRDTRLMVDANQRWSTEEALEQVPQLEASELSWIEEPLASDVAVEEWARVADVAQAPLAAGENLFELEAFRRLLAVGALGIIQPDLIKWGGVSGLAAVAAEAGRAGAQFIPHYLGSGVGLLATAHAVVALNPEARLELDVSENPLQWATVAEVPAIANGRMQLPRRSGHGADVPLRSLRRARLIESWG